MRNQYKGITQFLYQVLVFLFLLSFASPALSQVVEVETVGFTVSDMDNAVDFYTGVLSFEKTSDVEVYGSDYERLQGIFGLRMRVVTLRLGKESIELTEYLTPKGRPIPIDSRSNDLWFQHIAIVVSDMDKAYKKLRQHHVQHVSTAPQRIPDWNKAAAGIKAFYFRDWDQHNLEIIYFPQGKGDPRWQTNTDKLFLGIDHTAIVVSNTQASLSFYRDFLGLKVFGESENYGAEQEHLNQVFGTHLRITALRAPKGPGIELLEYLTPQDGRPYPNDSRPNDLLYWQTTLVSQNLEGLFQHAKDDHIKLISSGVTELPEETLGFQKGLLLRGPDGHAIRLIEE
jgi:catechol 2,3-dioxygenase-like lactoylglutathione lyase family enzyme